jgi:hypothetical protein
VFSVIALLVHLLTNGRYGYFRDDILRFFSVPVFLLDSSSRLSVVTLQKNIFGSAA